MRSSTNSPLGICACHGALETGELRIARSSAAQATGEPFRSPEKLVQTLDPVHRHRAARAPVRGHTRRSWPSTGQSAKRAGHAVSRRDWRLVELDETTHGAQPRTTRSLHGARTASTMAPMCNGLRSSGLGREIITVSGSGNLRL